MFRRSLFRLTVFLAGFGLVVSSIAASGQGRHRGRKYKAPPPTSRVEVTILRSDDGKPIRNAAVVFHLIGDKGNMEMKTDDDGRAVIDVLPTNSKVLLQVIAKGYQTYGGDYTLDKSQMAIEVKLNRPGKQYSIYQHHNTSDAGKSGGQDKAQGKDENSARKDGASNEANKDKQGAGDSASSQHK